jgi:hypothetical protein
LQDSQKAKLTFKGLRDLQKTFEDWYNTPRDYNYWGLILKGGGTKKDAILYFCGDSDVNMSLEHYAKWVLVGANHKAIVGISRSEENKTKEDCVNEVLFALDAKVVYGIANDLALKQLLRLNVEMDNNLGRKFDFEIYSKKSLEHIHPKSKEEDLKFIQNSELSVHCIGNLVLLDTNTNASFNDSLFDEKKELYFDSSNIKWSLKLLHSLKIFSHKEWNIDTIEKNKKTFINEFKKYYGIN